MCFHYIKSHLFYLNYRVHIGYVGEGCRKSRVAYAAAMLRCCEKAGVARVKGPSVFVISDPRVLPSPLPSLLVIVNPPVHCSWYASEKKSD